MRFNIGININVIIYGRMSLENAVANATKTKKVIKIVDFYQQISYNISRNSYICNKVVIKP